MSANLVNWDDLQQASRRAGRPQRGLDQPRRRDRHRGVGLRRIEIDPGKRSTPAHVHGAEEEIVYVLGGSGLSWQEGETFALAPGDCVVHLPASSAHTLIAGDDGLDVLIFGTRVAGRDRLAAAGARVVARQDVGVGGRGGAPVGARARRRRARAPRPHDPSPAAHRQLPSTSPKRRSVAATASASSATSAVAAGSRVTGLRHVVVPPETIGAPPHCHAADEEVFVVLDGEGALLLGGEEHPVRRGQRDRPPARNAAARTRCAPAKVRSPISPTAPASRATSRTTRAPTASTCAPSASRRGRAGRLRRRRGLVRAPVAR